MNACQGVPQLPAHLRKKKLNNEGGYGDIVRDAE